jgi:hypothetical protein
VAPTVIVLYGDNAPDIEQRTARRIAERTRLHGGWGYNLLSEGKALADTALLERSDLIVVGEPGTSELVRQHWSHWAWMPALGGRRPPYYTEAECRFFLFGVGSFRSEPVGYIYCDRNPFNRRAETRARVHDIAPPPRRTMVVVTGTDSWGVKDAADAFLATGLLNGVVSTGGVADARPPFEVPRAKLPTSLPGWLSPRDAGPFRWAGWHQPNALEYAGFREAAGVSPMTLWRVQYAPLPTPSISSPCWHRQDSEFEVVVAEMASPDAARDACASLRSSLGQEWHELHGVQGNAWWKQLPDGPFHVMSLGRYVLMETLPPPQDGQILREMAQQIPDEGSAGVKQGPRVIRLRPGSGG